MAWEKNTKKKGNIIAIVSPFGTVLRSALVKAGTNLPGITVTNPEQAPVPFVVKELKPLKKRKEITWQMLMPKFDATKEALAYEQGKIDGEASGISSIPANAIALAHPEADGAQIVSYLNGLGDGAVLRY